ncbi:transposase [Roseiflexus castenholzii]|uniref:transposase n=1 Tax=Roseiflexus TaxID=120961 RepID=UPI000A0369EF
MSSPRLSPPLRRTDGRVRPRRHPREVMNGILWVMRTGAAWADMPSRYQTIIDRPHGRPGRDRGIRPGI